jgi:hypothetical protein
MSFRSRAKSQVSPIKASILEILYPNFTAMCTMQIFDYDLDDNDAMMAMALAAQADFELCAGSWEAPPTPKDDGKAASASNKRVAAVEIPDTDTEEQKKKRAKLEAQAKLKAEILTPEEEIAFNLNFVVTMFETERELLAQYKAENPGTPLSSDMRSEIKKNAYIIAEMTLSSIGDTLYDPLDPSSANVPYRDARNVRIVHRVMKKRRRSLAARLIS